MYTSIIIIHVIASLFLIAVILLQAGRGGGLADTFGGSQMQSLFGTKSASVMTRLTTICATLFIITCLTLAITSSRRSRSVIDKLNIPVPIETTETADAVDVKTVAEEVVDMTEYEAVEEMPVVPEEMPKFPGEAPAE
ncbi:MAG: preprotein translocase subunit SecG [Candidatus Omnitrophica bacterium]|nr:preprotein translocase subunit SecG [Candidatus Omnitrophota bacterium]